MLYKHINNRQPLFDTAGVEYYLYPVTQTCNGVFNMRPGVVDVCRASPISYHLNSRLDYLCEKPSNLPIVVLF